MGFKGKLKSQRRRNTASVASVGSVLPSNLGWLNLGPVFLKGRKGVNFPFKDKQGPLWTRPREGASHHLIGSQRKTNIMVFGVGLCLIPETLQVCLRCLSSDSCAAYCVSMPLSGPQSSQLENGVRQGMEIFSPFLWCETTAGMPRGTSQWTSKAGGLVFGAMVLISAKNFI